MISTKKFKSISEIQALQKAACDVQDDVYIHSTDGKIMVDAKSFIGLFSIDFSQEVNIVTENEHIHKLIAKGAI